MYKLLTIAQIRELEAWAMRREGITEKRLMLDAGTAVADFVFNHIGMHQMSVAVICGPGKNGGDGWVAARVLHSRGCKVTVYTTIKPAEATGLLAEIIYEATSAGVHWEYWEVSPGPDVFNDYGLLVDALLGIGARLPLGDEPGDVGYWCKMMNQSRSPVVAIDVPTGCVGDTGDVDENAILALSTVTMLGAKLGLSLAPAARHTGDIMVADLGVKSDLWDGEADNHQIAPLIFTDQEYAMQLPLPAFDANKYTRGRVLIVAGSRSWPGAAIMATLAACRCGAGYVQLAVPASVAPLARTHLLTAPVVELPETRSGHIDGQRALNVLSDLLAKADSVLIGPGLGLEKRLTAMIERFVFDETLGIAGIPLVIDADALGAFSGQAQRLAKDARHSLVLTPHSGEAVRLLGRAIEPGEVLRQSVDLAREMSGPSTVCVLKGPSTVIAGGSMTVIDSQGPPTLATAGTGDVLAGMIAALLAQGVNPLIAAALAVRLQAHSAALATEDLTPLSVTALDVIDNIPDAARGLMQTLHPEES